MLDVVKSFVLPLAVVSALMAGSVALAGGQHAGGHDHDADDQHAEDRKHHADHGQPGEPNEVDRTIVISAEGMSFKLETIEVEKGETIRFVVRNTGDLLHEFNIATPSAHKAHQKEMREMMQAGALTATGDHTDEHQHSGDMTHDHANSVLVEPGETKELVWTFTEPSRLEFACNIPGHYAAGMKGQIEFANDA